MNFFKKLFNKREYNIGIIRFGDNIVIPGRDYFKDENKIKLLEEYKNHYIEELSRKNAITTLNFNSNQLKKDMNMNVDLILRVLMDNEDFYLFAPEELIIQSLKLKMYYEEISVLEEETILRLVALKEIEKSKRVPRRNRMALEEEINQLSIILEMYSYRKSVINIELKNYFDVLSTRNLEKQDTEILKERLNKLLFITDRIRDKEELDKYEDIKTKIAILERKCEKYAYSNKEEADRLKDSFDLSSENKILLFYEYGKDYYDLEFMKKFYSYKFNELTSNINNDTSSSPINKKDYGFEYYKDIVAYEIENMQNSYYFTELANDKSVDVASLLENAKNYLRNEHNEFDYEEILLNKYKLAFILSLKYENRLIDFFDKNKLYLNETSEFKEILTNILGVEWCDSIPLSSLFELITNDKTHLLYSFYTLNRIETNLLVPEGIKSVDFIEIDKEYIRKIESDILSGKKYSLPSTLKSISGYIDWNHLVNFPSLLSLNDGLEYIGPMLFTDKRMKISIPSSVEEISSAQNTCNVDCIEFRDFKNSKILNDEEKFLKFIEIFSTETDTHKSVRHMPSERNLEIQKKYSSGHYSTSNYAALFDHKYILYVYMMGMLFSELVFTSDDIEEPIVISSSDLKTTFYKKESFYGELIGDRDCYKIYSKIREIIKEKTGYDIFKSDEIKTK